MKPSQVNKLYSKLTPHEQAALVIEAAARLDENEADAIMAQVERKHYISTHADYTRRIHALTSLIGQYGIKYWQIRTLMLLACEYADQDNQQAEATALQFLAKAVALEAAMVEVCKRLKVDIKAIKKMAGCPDEDVKPEELEKANKKLVEQYTDMFAGLVSH
jgi:chromosome condensin MukBEF ATPase and DNA-binding subunit MukB